MTEILPEPSLTIIPATMRALVLDGVGVDHLSVRQVPVPRPGPGQILARVDAAGICTSLLKLIDQGPKHSFLNGWDLAHFPIILGDEGALTLVEIGEALREEYRVGERYVVQPAVDHAPINYRERFNDNARGMTKLAVGYSLPGHLAEYMLIPEEIFAAKCLVPVPDPAMPNAHAAIAEPLSCVISAQDHHVHLVQSNPLTAREAVKGLLPGGVTAIIGAGAMGRMHVDLALSYAPRALVVADLIDERLALTRDLFAGRAGELGIPLHTINTRAGDLKAFVGELTDYRGADDVIVAVGVAKVIESAQELLGRGAVLNLFGGLKKGEDIVGLNTTTVHYKEVNVTGSSGGSPWDIARTLDLMASGAINAASHITRIGDLAHAPQFLEMIRAQALDGKAVVYPHRPTPGILTVRRWTAEDERAYLAESER